MRPAADHPTAPSTTAHDPATQPAARGGGGSAAAAEALEADAAAAADGILALPIWLTGIIGVLCFALGFLVGTRAKQIIAAAKKSAKALVTLKELLKAGADEQDGADDNEAEEDEEEEEKVVDILDRYLSTDVDYGLDDHADVVRNPILMYQVKLAKEAERLEKRRAALIAEGFDEDEVDRILEAEARGDFVGVGRSGAKMNPLALLISVGARAKPLAGGGGAEAAAADERRRAAQGDRSLPAEGARHRGQEDLPRPARCEEEGRQCAGGCDKDEEVRHGGEKALRVETSASTAKRGRNNLRLVQEDRRKRDWILSLPKKWPSRRTDRRAIPRLGAIRTSTTGPRMTRTTRKRRRRGRISQREIGLQDVMYNRMMS